MKELTELYKETIENDIKNYDSFMDIFEKLCTIKDDSIEAGADIHTIDILNRASSSILEEARFCLAAAKMNFDAYREEDKS